MAWQRPSRITMSVLCEGLSRIISAKVVWSTYDMQDPDIWTTQIKDLIVTIEILGDQLTQIGT